MHRMGAQVHGLGANEPTCTPWQRRCHIARKFGGLAVYVTIAKLKSTHIFYLNIYMYSIDKLH